MYLLDYLRSKTETLLKAGYSELLYKFSNSELYQYWNALRIVMRNKYKPKEIDIYYDYLKMLSELNRDLRNSFYVCPKNLHKSHDEIVKILDKKKQKERAKNDRRKLEQELQKNKKDIAKFIISKQKYFGLSFTEKGISIEVLSSIEDYIKEARIMNHCVLQGKYYNRENSLVLRSFVNNKPAETIEVCLKEFKILQSRGKLNKATEHHDKIVELMNKNLITIKKIALNEKELKTA